MPQAVPQSLSASIMRQARAQQEELDAEALQSRQTQATAAPPLVRETSSHLQAVLTAYMLCVIIHQAANCLLLLVLLLLLPRLQHVQVSVVLYKEGGAPQCIVGTPHTDQHSISRQCSYHY